jgi:hypothetical protein
MTPELIEAIGKWIVSPALMAWFLYLISNVGKK